MIRFICLMSMKYTLYIDACTNIKYIYIYIKTTEKFNSLHITLVEKNNLIELVEGQVTKNN